MTHLASLPGSAERELAIDSFWAQLPAVPWIDGDTAHFLYRGSISSLALAGDFNFWNPAGDPCDQASGTTLWYRSKVFEPHARLDYKLVRNGSEWILDPANPLTVSGGFGPNSELAMPAYVQPWEIQVIPGVPAGSISTSSLASTNTGRTYSLQIYLPAGYDEDREWGYPVAYFQDGHEYVGLASAARIFDNLIDSGLIEPLIGVFVRPTDRSLEYAGGLRFSYADFFGEELVSYIDENYNSATQARDRAVIGPSFGGNISAIITMAHPDVFGNCGLQSGAFWPNSFETYTNWLSFDADDSLKVAAIWGSYEGSLVANMNDFVVHLAAENTPSIWDELPQGHSWGLWRSTLDDMLTFFFPPRDPVSGIWESAEQPSLGIYPNPGREYFMMDVPETMLGGILQIHDQYGRMIRSIEVMDRTLYLDLNGLSAGTYQVQVHKGKLRANASWIKTH